MFPIFVNYYTLFLCSIPMFPIFVTTTQEKCERISEELSESVDINKILCQICDLPVLNTFCRKGLLLQIEFRIKR